jgi:hypothetical protein
LGDADKVCYRYALLSGQGLMTTRLSKVVARGCLLQIQAARSISIAESFYQMATQIVMTHSTLAVLIG